LVSKTGIARRLAHARALDTRLGSRAGGPDAFHRLTKPFYQKVPPDLLLASSLRALLPVAAWRSLSRLTTIPRRSPEV